MIIDNKMDLPRYSPLTHQLFVLSGILSTILSCGLSLGFLTVLMDPLTVLGNNFQINEHAARSIEAAGEIAFVPSIILIPYMMQRKGRRIASFATTLPLFLGWIVAFMEKSTMSCMITNMLYSTAIGGAVAISSVIISEFCSPKFRSAFLMLETAMLSLGILLSHVCGILSYLRLIPIFGILSASFSIAVTYFSPESPYWLISQGHFVKSTEIFYWLRGRDEDSQKEMDSLLMTFRVKIQSEALKPIIKTSLRKRITEYLKSMMSVDFLKPLSIMILLLSFVGFGGESLITRFSFRDIFKSTNAKYISTIILDVITVVCSLTACILVHIVKRKTLFIFTGSLSILFLSITSLFVFLNTLGMLSPDCMWLILTFGTLFAMFMSLGTTALPFSLLGEIFPLSYKGVGSSLTCAYLWAFGNSIIRFAPQFSSFIGVHGVLFICIFLMVIILIILNKIMPETSGRSLLEIDDYMNLDSKVHNELYEVVRANEEENESFDKLKLFIEYA